jgi:hypothetical protein
MRIEKQVTLTILPDKRVEVLVTTIYMVEEEELTRKHFRFILDIGEYGKAREHLDESYIKVLEALWEE